MENEIFNKMFLVRHLPCDRLDLRRGAYQGCKFVIALYNELYRCQVCSTVRYTRCCVFRDEIRAMYVNWIQILDCNVLILWCDIYIAGHQYEFYSLTSHPHPHPLLTFLSTPTHFTFKSMARFLGSGARKGVYGNLCFREQASHSPAPPH